MGKKREIELEYQNVIMQPPVAKEALYSQSCSNDKRTVDAWRPTWISQYKANKEKYGSFADHSVGKLFGKMQTRPCIIAGSGPSLKNNVHLLKKEKRREIGLVSCLHNFHFLEDHGVKADYYVTLDAGPVTIEEVYEGGQKTEQEYWDLTRDHTLVAYVGTNPTLLEKWRGEVLFFNCPVPDQQVTEAMDAIEPFHLYLSTGGNVLGASMYFAKGIMGAGSIIYVGADFCFDYGAKFHAWDSKYDNNMGQCVSLFDVFGNKRLTWQSYANFKAWFDYIAMHVPGQWFNCTEGGCLGAYPEGNLHHFKIMDLADCYNLFFMNDHLLEQVNSPATAEKKILF